MERVKVRSFFSLAAKTSECGGDYVVFIQKCFVYTRKNESMAKRRNLALSMKNLEGSAKFYEDAFGIRRARQSNVTIMPSDGVISLTLLHLRSNNNTPDKRGYDYIGMHHMGFLVDDGPGASEAVEAAGDKYQGKILNVGAGPELERRYPDPNSMVIDVTSPAHADSPWRVPKDT